MEYFKIIKYAIEMSRDFCLDVTNISTLTPSNQRYHYKADIVDRGWIGYITKELDVKHTHNLYLP
jgi:predicted DNA-binding transcriptional regulator